MNIQQYEPILTNRFLLKFPTEMGIPVESIDSVQLPMEGQMGVTVKNFVGVDLLEKISNIKKYKNFILEFDILDPSNIVIESYVIPIEKIESVSVHPFSYKMDAVHQVVLFLKAKELISKKTYRPAKVNFFSRLFK